MTRGAVAALAELPLSWTALERLHDHFARVAREVCNGGAAVAPQLLVVAANAAGEPEAVEPASPALMQLLHRDGPSKELLARLIQALLDEGSEQHRAFREQVGFAPNVLVHICEVWLHVAKPGADEYASGKRPVSSDPQRQEGVLVALHTRAGTVPVCHLIDPGPPRRCVAAKFPGPELFAAFGGRFAMQDALPPEGPLH